MCSQPRSRLISSRLAIMDLPGDIMVPTTPLRKSLISVSIGRLFTEMPMTWSHSVTLVNVKAKSRNVMKCLKMQFKYARSLTLWRHTTLWARSLLLDGNKIHSRSRSDYLSLMGFDAKKALPTNDARVVVKILKSLFARFGTPHAIISDRGTHFCNDHLLKLCLSMELLIDFLSPEELNSEIPDAIIESFSPSPIPVEDSDSLMEEIDIFLAPDDSIPPGIENDDYDSEGDVLFLEELLNDDSISLPEYESFHVDFYNVPSSPRPPEKPPDDDVYFDIEPDTGVLTTKVVDDISDNSTRELYVHVPNVLPTLPTLYLVFDTLLPFSSEIKDKVFNPGILISKKEKSPHLLSHRGFKVFPLINDSKSPMMIYGGDIPILDVPYLYFYPP
ncbi:hypothetical protein Tco_0469869 [Tanacetum coccineum]